MVDWRYVICTLGGVEIGELWNAGETRGVRDLNGLATVSGTIAGDHPMVDTIIGATAADRVRILLKAYRNGQRFLVGQMTDVEESMGADGAGELSFAAASPLWRLLQRLIGKTVSGYGDGTPLATLDLGLIARHVIEVVNAERDTGIRIGAIGASSNSYLERVYFKKAGEIIVELAAGAKLGGYDFDLTPVEPVADSGGIKIAEFNTYGSKGQHRPEVVLEYGSGKRNIQSWRHPINGSGRVTRAYSLAVGFPDAVAAGDTPVVSTTGNDAEGTGERMEEVVGSSDLGVLDLRQKLTAAHVAIRKHPREQFLITPVTNLEFDYGVDYVEGDTIVVRIVNPETGVVRVNGAVRIYGVSFARDEQGNETPELTIVPE